MVEQWTYNPAVRVQVPPKSLDFLALFAVLYSLLRFSYRKMEAQSELGLNSTLKWLNAMPKGLSNDDFLEEGECYGR